MSTTPDPASGLPPSARILVRGVNWLGDAVMTTPALRRLREAWPRAHLALLTPRKLADLWQRHTSVDDVIAIDAGEPVFRVARRLRRGGFDAALVLPNSPRSALEVFLAGIPRRIGHARPWRNLFLTHRVTPRPEAVPMRKRSVAEIKRLITEPATAVAPSLPPTAHQLHHYLHLAATLGANPEVVPPLVVVLDAEVEAVKALLPSASAGVKPWFGLAPGAEYGPAKRWPAERFIAAAVALHRRAGGGWLIFGGPGDAPVAEAITAGLRAAALPHVVDLAGRTSLRDLCAALKLCRLLLTNDSGPMHLAAAVGTPVVVPFGSTSPQLTAPGLPGDSRHAVVRAPAPCAPCFRRECPIDFRCMTGISVEQVIAAALRALG